MRPWPCCSLRQGALEGVTLEAIAAAAGVPAADVRWAAMVTGSLGAVARMAMGKGAAGLARFDALAAAVPSTLVIPRLVGLATTVGRQPVVAYRTER